MPHRAPMAVSRLIAREPQSSFLAATALHDERAALLPYDGDNGAAVLHEEARADVFDGPGRREAAITRHGHTCPLATIDDSRCHAEHGCRLRSVMRIEGMDLRCRGKNVEQKRGKEHSTN
jgi:hypothetical protein